MKKLIGAIAGCIAACYVFDVLAAVSIACAWSDLVKMGHVQAANELSDTFHKKYCKHDQKVFDFFTDGYYEYLENKH